MALGPATFSDLGGAASDLFGAEGLRAKAQGDEFERQNYNLAAQLADQNEKFTEQSTAIKQMQLDRQNTQTIGGQQADVAGAGFAASGSALDLLRDSASQGALTKAVGGEQGLITEAGYSEQAKSYRNLASAAQLAENAENNAANNAFGTALFKGVAAVATMFTGAPIGVGGGGADTGKGGG